VTNSRPQLDSAKLRPPRPTAGTTAAQKLEARRHQMAVKQRERLEEERKALKAEVETLVFRSFLLAVSIFNLRL
jgi:DASH complex subunit SPC19